MKARCSAIVFHECLDDEIYEERRRGR